MKTNAILLAAALCLAASPAAALFSFGVHVGLDMNGQDAQDLTIEDINELAEQTDVTLNYEEIGNPMLLGVHVLVDVTPIVDVEFGVEGSFKKYNLYYRAFEPLDDGQIGYFEKDTYFARIQGYISGKINVLSLPTVKVFGGGGVNYGLMTPLASENLITEVTQDGDFELEVEDIIDRKGTFGGHLLAGARLKPPTMPFAILLEGRYYFLQQNDYEDETQRFASILAGFELAF